MPLITVKNHPQLLAKSTDTAPGRAVMALQSQTGRKLSDLRDEGAFSETLNVYIMAFLSLSTAGIFETWDELIERPVSDFEIVATEKEKVEAAEREAEEKEDAGPPPASTASPQDASDAHVTAKPKAASKPRSSSSATNPG